MKQPGASSWLIAGILFVLLFLPGCEALNPLCGSARPKPSIGSLSPSTISFAQVQQGFVLGVSGSNFVASTVAIVDGKTVATTVTSSQQLRLTITTSQISGPGDANVKLNTPSGNSGSLGCTSGGTSSALKLTVT